MRNILATAISLSLFLAVGFLAYMYYPENHFALAYQKTADCQRQQDIHQTAKLVERYFKLTGHYPLADNRMISVVLSEETLPRQFKVNPPPAITGELRSAAELKKALEITLNENIRLPADPQTAFAWGSRFYLYQLSTDGNYSLSATLFSSTPQTLKQDSYHHLYRVGSAAMGTEKIQPYSAIENRTLECATP